MKPIKVKPSIYAYYFEALKVIAVKYGYCLALHGSMERDLDIIAVPWQAWCKQEFELQMLQEMDMEINGKKSDDPNYYLPTKGPHGRTKWVINVNRGGAWNNYKDEQYYIDISIMQTVTEATQPNMRH